MVDRTLASVLTTLAAYLPLSLVPGGSLEKMAAQIGDLPFQMAGQSFGFELPLDCSESIPDFAACLGPVGRDYYLKELACWEKNRSLAGKGFQELCEKWAGDINFNRVISNIWLEYDTDLSGMNRLPGVFVTLTRRIFNHPGFVFETLEVIKGKGLAASLKNNVSRLLHHLHPPLRISQIGYLPARDEGGFRFCVKGLEFETLSPLLERLGLQDSLDSQEDLLREISGLTDFPVLHLDIGTEISSKIGVEFRLAGDDLEPTKQPRWFRFLDFLTKQGMCTPTKKDALVQWPGTTWEIHDPDLRAFATYRFLYYFKGVFASGRPVKIKSYFGFVNSTRFLEQENIPPFRAPSGYYNKLTNRARNAVERGIEFLVSDQMKSGEFKTFIFRGPQLNNKSFDTSPFVTSLVLYSSLFFPKNQLSSLQFGAYDFLMTQRQKNFLWSYWGFENPKKIVPDMDDTCCISFILKRLNPGLGVSENINLILHNRNTKGLFRTWFKSMDEANDVDSVVNANVLLYLGEREETCTARDYVNDCILKGGEEDSYHYYLNNLAFYYMVTRAAYNGVVSFEKHKSVIIENILALRKLDHSFGNTLDTAIALCTLQNFHYSGKEIEAGIFRLLEEQESNGMWKEYPFYCGPEYPAIPNVFFGSPALTTAFCLEALCRFIR